MSHQSESTPLQAIFEPAFQAYEKISGVSLTQHPLTIELESCNSVEAVTGLFQDQVHAFRDLQGSDKIMKSLETTVSILSKLSLDAFGLVRQKSFMAYFTSLTFIYRRSPLRRRYRLVLLS